MDNNNDKWKISFQWIFNKLRLQETNKKLINDIKCILILEK